MSAARARDTFVIGLGLVGVALAVLFALTLDVEEAPPLSTWRLLGTAVGGAISATLLVELLRALVARRGLAAVALRGLLLLVNGLYFLAQLVLLVVTASL